METIELFGEPVEFIDNKYMSFGFPAVSVNKYHIYFNKLASDLLPEYVKFATNSEYVLIYFCDRKTASNYKVFNSTGKDCRCRLPSVLRDEKKVQPGYYKLYKFNGGLAFKRYEQISE